MVTLPCAALLKPGSPFTLPGIENPGMDANPLRKLLTWPLVATLCVADSVVVLVSLELPLSATAPAGFAPVLAVVSFVTFPVLVSTLNSFFGSTKTF